MEAKKLLTIALTGLLAGGCLMVPALAEDADGQSSGNPATYTIPARVKRILRRRGAAGNPHSGGRDGNRRLRLFGLHEFAGD